MALKKVGEKKERKENQIEFGKRFSIIENLIQKQNLRSAEKELNSITKEAKILNLEGVLYQADLDGILYRVKELLRPCKEHEIKKRFPTIENLIKEKKISKAIKELNHLIYMAKSYNLKGIFNEAYEKLNYCKRLKTKNLKEEFPRIEKLIQEMKFSNATEELKNMRIIAKKYNLDEIINWVKKNLDVCYRHIIKRLILELGTKFTRLQTAEISEACNINDDQLIIDVVKEMIDNKEIYAQYFSSTKAVAFNQQANIDEIDKLMATYKEWEIKKVGKK